MQVIEAQRASILEPHDHLHISQMRASPRGRFTQIAARVPAGDADSRYPGHRAGRQQPDCPIGGMSERLAGATREGEGNGPVSARSAGSRSGWLEKAQDQKSWFLAQPLVVLGITFAHRFGRDRLNDFLDQESGISRSRAQRG